MSAGGAAAHSQRMAADDTRVRVSDLPLQPRAIIGRAAELAAARQHLLRSDVRLLTLTGPPGVGKTRLALALASDVSDAFADGVRFIDLAPITDPHLVVHAIADGLGLHGIDRRVILDMVEEFARDRSLLLVLDNFEQVLEAAPVVGRLLGSSPGVKVVATSRAPLHLRWEHELRLPPLSWPPLDATPLAHTVAASPAGRLFIERAQAVAHDFALGDADAAAVAEICARLDGLPLAIELAAARIKLFPPRALLRRLARAEPADSGQASPLRLLVNQARDLPPRQQTLVRAINWSYDLLDADEQALFRRLSVFVGGCSLEAAEAVAACGIADGATVIASLVDQSLVGREEQPDGEPRLRMLETLREHAGERLAASHEADAVREHHARYYLDLVEQVAVELIGPHQHTCFARLDRERDNLRAAERWASTRGDADVIVRLAAALWPFWLAREDASQARARLELILPLLDHAPRGLALVQALHGAGLMAEKLGDYAICRSLLERSLAHARELNHPGALATVLDALGRQAFIEGRYLEARALLEESQAILEEINDRPGLARVLSHVGFLEYLEGRPAAARTVFERGLALAVAAEDQHRVAEFLDNLGNAAELEGNLGDAALRFEAAISIWRKLGQGHWLAMSLNNLGRVEVRQRARGPARQHLREGLSLAHRMGNRRRMAYTLTAVAGLAAAEGHTERAASLQAVASATLSEVGATSRAYTGSEAGAAHAHPPTLTLDRAVEEALAWLTPSDEGATAPSTGLTPRERDVVALVALGLSNRQIGEALVLSEGTVENYVQRILGKLNYNKRAQIAVWAVEHGLAATPK